MQTLKQRNDTNGNTEMIVKRVSVPIGLEELMEGLSKEVILKKPKDICLFASKYFAKLINLRETNNKYKAHPVHTIQSVTKLKNIDVPPFKKISPARPNKHLSRQLSIRSKSPLQHRPTQTESNTRRNASSKNRERKAGTDSITRGISKIVLPRDLSKSINTKGGTSTGTSSVQSTPRDKEHTSVTRKVKSSISDAQNKARDENKKTPRVPKRSKSEKVKTALISPTVIEGTVTSSDVVATEDKKMVKENDENRIFESNILEESTKIPSINNNAKSINLPQSENEHVGKDSSNQIKLDDQPNAPISKSPDNSLDSDILAQSTNVAEVSKNIHRSEENLKSLEENKDNVISSVVLTDEKEQSSQGNSETRKLEKDTKEDEKNNQEDRKDDEKNIENKVKNMTNRNSEHIDDKEQTQVQSSAEYSNLKPDKPDAEYVEQHDNVSIKDESQILLLDNNQDAEKISKDAMDLVQSIRSETGTASSTNNNLNVENVDNVNEQTSEVNLKEDGKYLKLTISNDQIPVEGNFGISDITIKEKNQGGKKESTENETNTYTTNKVKKSDRSDMADTNLYDIDSFISEKKLSKEEIGIHKNTLENAQEINAKGNTDLNTLNGYSHDGKTNREYDDNKGKSHYEKITEGNKVIQTEIVKQSDDKSQDEIVNETEPSDSENKDIISDNSIPKIVTPIMSAQEIIEGFNTEHIDTLQDSQYHASQINTTEKHTNHNEKTNVPLFAETLGHQPSDLSTNEEQNNSKNENQLLLKEADEENTSKSVESEKENKNDMKLLEKTDDSTKRNNVDSKVTIKMEKIGESDDLLIVTIPENVDTENIDEVKGEKSSKVKNDNEISGNMDQIHSTDDIKPIEKQFFRKNEELVSKEDDKTKININDSDGVTVKDSQGQETDVPKEKSGKMDVSDENGLKDLKKDNSDESKLLIQETELAKQTYSNSQEETLIKNESISNADKDNNILKELHEANINTNQNKLAINSNDNQQIINYEISQNHPDVTVKNVLTSFINNEQLNVFKNKEGQEEDHHVENKIKIEESEKHIDKKENDDALPTHGVKVYAASPLTFSSVKDLLNFDPSSRKALNNVKTSEESPLGELDLENTQIIGPKRNNVETSVNNFVQKSLLNRDDETQFPREKRSVTKEEVTFDSKIESTYENNNHSLAEISMLDEAGHTEVNKKNHIEGDADEQILNHHHHEIMELKNGAESFSNRETLASNANLSKESNNESNVLNVPNIQRLLKENLSEIDMNTEADDHAENSLSETKNSKEDFPDFKGTKTKTEVDNVLNLDFPENEMKKVEESTDHINARDAKPEKLGTDKKGDDMTSLQNMENLDISTEDTPMKTDKNTSEKNSKLKIRELTEIVSATDIIKNIMSSKIAVQRPGVLDSSVSQYLNSFLSKEQSNVFQHKPVGQNKSAKLKNHRTISAEKPTLDNNKVLLLNKANARNNSMESKKIKGKTDKPLLSKKERSRSQENILSMERKLPETTKNSKMRRVRSVGIIKPVESEYKSKIPTSARRSAGRRPLVRQLESDSRDIEEKLTNTKELRKISPGMSPRNGGKEGRMQNTKNITNRAETHFLETEGEKIENEHQKHNKEPLIEKNTNTMVFKDIVTKEDMLNMTNKRYEEAETDKINYEHEKDIHEPQNETDIHKMVSNDVVTKEDVLIAKTILHGIQGAEKHIELIEGKITSNAKNELETDGKSDNKNKSVQNSKDITDRGNTLDDVNNKSEVGINGKKENISYNDRVESISKKIHGILPEKFIELKDSETSSDPRERLLENQLEKTVVAGKTVVNTINRGNILRDINSKSDVDSVNRQKENSSDLNQDESVSKGTHEDQSKTIKDSNGCVHENVVQKTDMASENIESFTDIASGDIKSKNDDDSANRETESSLNIDQDEPISKERYENQYETLKDLKEHSHEDVVEKTADETIESAIDRGDISGNIKSKTDVGSVNGEKESILEFASDNKISQDSKEYNHVPEDIKNRSDVDSVNDEKRSMSDLDQVESISKKILETRPESLTKGDESEMLKDSTEQSYENILEKSDLTNKTVENAIDMGDISGNTKSETDVGSVNSEKENVSNLDRDESFTKKVLETQLESLLKDDNSEISNDSKKQSHDNFVKKPDMANEAVESATDRGKLSGSIKSKNDVESVNDEKERMTDIDQVVLISQKILETHPESLSKGDESEIFKDSKEHSYENILEKADVTNKTVENAADIRDVSGNIKSESNVGSINGEKENISNLDQDEPFTKKALETQLESLTKGEGSEISKDSKEHSDENLEKKAYVVSEALESATDRGDILGNIESKSDVGSVNGEKESSPNLDQDEPLTKKKLETQLESLTKIEESEISKDSKEHENLEKKAYVASKALESATYRGDILGNIESKSDVGSVNGEKESTPNLDQDESFTKKALETQLESVTKGEESEISKDSKEHSYENLEKKAYMASEPLESAVDRGDILGNIESKSDVGSVNGEKKTISNLDRVEPFTKKALETQLESLTEDEDSEVSKNSEDHSNENLIEKADMPSEAIESATNKGDISGNIKSKSDVDIVNEEKESMPDFNQIESMSKKILESKPESLTKGEESEISKDSKVHSHENLEKKEYVASEAVESATDRGNILGNMENKSDVGGVNGEKEGISNLDRVESFTKKTLETQLESLTKDEDSEISKNSKYQSHKNLVQIADMPSEAIESATNTENISGNTQRKSNVDSVNEEKEIMPDFDQIEPISKKILVTEPKSLTQGEVFEISRDSKHSHETLGKKAYVATEAVESPTDRGDILGNIENKSDVGSVNGEKGSISNLARVEAFTKKTVETQLESLTKDEYSEISKDSKEHSNENILEKADMASEAIESATNQGDKSGNIKSKSDVDSVNDEKESMPDFDQIDQYISKKILETQPESLTKGKESEVSKDSQEHSNENLVEKADMASEAIESVTNKGDISGNIKTKSDVDSVNEKNESIPDLDQIDSISNKILEIEPESLTKSEKSEISKDSKEHSHENLEKKAYVDSASVKSATDRGHIIENMQSKSDIGSINGEKKSISDLDRVESFAKKTVETQLESLTKDNSEISKDFKEHSNENLVDKADVASEAITSAIDKGDILSENVKSKRDVDSGNHEKERMTDIDQVESISKKVLETQPESLTKGDDSEILKDSTEHSYENILEKPDLTNKTVENALDMGDISGNTKSEIDVGSVNGEKENVSNLGRGESFSKKILETQPESLTIGDESEISKDSKAHLHENHVEKADVANKTVESVTNKGDILGDTKSKSDGRSVKRDTESILYTDKNKFVSQEIHEDQPESVTRSGESETTKDFKEPLTENLSENIDVASKTMKSVNIKSKRDVDSINGNKESISAFGQDEIVLNETNGNQLESLIKDDKPKKLKDPKEQPHKNFIEKMDATGETEERRDKDKQYDSFVDSKDPVPLSKDLFGDSKVKKKERIGVKTLQMNHDIKTVYNLEKNDKPETVENITTDEAAAAATIQKTWKGFYVRKDLGNKITNSDGKLENAKKGDETVTKNKLQKELNAAIKIQSLWRGYVERKIMANSGKKYGKLKLKQEEAITKIQAVVRGYLGRLKYKKLRTKNIALSDEAKNISNSNTNLGKIYSDQQDHRLEDENTNNPLEEISKNVKDTCLNDQKVKISADDTLGTPSIENKEKEIIKSKKSIISNENPVDNGYGANTKEATSDKKEEEGTKEKNVDELLQATFSDTVDQESLKDNKEKREDNHLEMLVVQTKDREKKEHYENLLERRNVSVDHFNTSKEKISSDGKVNPNVECQNDGKKLEKIKNSENQEEKSENWHRNIENGEVKKFHENLNDNNSNGASGTDIEKRLYDNLNDSKHLMDAFINSENRKGVEDHAEKGDDNTAINNENLENSIKNKGLQENSNNFTNPSDGISNREKSVSGTNSENIDRSQKLVEGIKDETDKTLESELIKEIQKEHLDDPKNLSNDYNNQIKDADTGTNGGKISPTDIEKNILPEKNANEKKENFDNQDIIKDLDIIRNEYKEKNTERSQENFSNDKNILDDDSKKIIKHASKDTIQDNKTVINIAASSINSEDNIHQERDDSEQKNCLQEAEECKNEFEKNMLTKGTIENNSVLDETMDNKTDIQKNLKNDKIIKDGLDTIHVDKNLSVSVFDPDIENNITNNDLKDKKLNNEKPNFYRSDTVLEPAIVKKAVSCLGDSKNRDDNSGLSEKDGNNNTQRKEETKLESEVRSAIDKIINGNNKNTSSLEVEIKMAVKDIMENNIDKSDDLAKDGEKKSESLNEETIPSYKIPELISKEIHTKDHTTKNIEKHETQNILTSIINVQSNKITNGLSQTDELDTPKEDVPESDISNKKNENYPALPATLDNLNDLNDKYLKNSNESSSSEINTDESSVDSVDSAITVVPNVNYETSVKKEYASMDHNILPTKSLSHDIMKEKENKEALSKNFVNKSLSTDALKGHVDLIDQVQNTLLDQISGKPVNTTSKFDIEQLRQELHEAASLYKSEEDEDPHYATHDDELLEYLNDFEPEDDNSYDSKIIRTPIRELPDIEEEVDSSNDDTETTRKASSNQGTLEFCKTPSNTACGVEKIIDNKPLKDHVEILNLEKLKQGHNEIVINNNNIQINRTESDGEGGHTVKESNQKLLHTSELHDMVIPMGSSTNRNTLVGSDKLKHTSEFHDTLVVPLPSGSDVKIKNEAKAMLAKDKPKEPTKAESVDTGNQTAIQQSPAGAPIVTSRRSSQDGAAVAEAQASLRDTSPAKPKSMESFTHQSPPQSPRFVKQAMESEHNNNKRNNAISKNVSATGKNMETQAATKIQAGFRGYQVRKQLKTKNAATDKSNQERHSLRRKSSGRKNIKDSDLAEKSAVKIQAGVRGFLVRRRQKKQVNSSASA